MQSGTQKNINPTLEKIRSDNDAEFVTNSKRKFRVTKSKPAAFELEGSPSGTKQKSEMFPANDEEPYLYGEVDCILQLPKNF